MKLFDSMLVKYLGDFGRFQWLMIAYLVFMAVPIAFDIDESMFEAHVPDYWCPPPGLNPDLLLRFNRSQLQRISAPPKQRFGHQCEYVEREYNKLTGEAIEILLNVTGKDPTEDLPTRYCTHWEYFNAEFKWTIVTEWALVCDREWIAKAQESIYLIGMLVGVTLFSVISDRYGRKPVIAAGLICQTASRLGCAFAYDVTSFTIFRFLEAATSTAWFYNFYILAVEYCSPRWRPLVGVLSPIGFAISNLSMVGLAYVLQEWGFLTLAITFFSLPFFIATWYLPESARWLAAVGRRDDADTLINKIARINKVEISEKFKLHIEKSPRKCLPADLFGTPNLRKFTYINCGVWSLLMLAYYGKFVNTHYLPGSIYVHFGLNSLIDVPAMLIYGPIISKCGRKMPLSVSLIVCGLSLFLCIAIPSDRLNIVLTSIHVVNYVIGKVAIAGAFAIIHLHTVEAYPTLIRSMGLAVATSAGRIAGTLAYAIDLLDVYNDIISHTLFALAALGAGILALMLPETKGWPLLDTVEDGEKCALLQPTWEKWETWEKWHQRRTSKLKVDKVSYEDHPEKERLTRNSSESAGLHEASLDVTDPEKDGETVKERSSFKQEQNSTKQCGQQLSDASHFDRSTYSDNNLPRAHQSDGNSCLPARSSSFCYVEDDDPARQMARW